MLTNVILALTIFMLKTATASRMNANVTTAQLLRVLIATLMDPLSVQLVQRATIYPSLVRARRIFATVATAVSLQPVRRITLSLVPPATLDSVYQMRTLARTMFAPVPTVWLLPPKTVKLMAWRNAPAALLSSIWKVQYVLRTNAAVQTVTRLLTTHVCHMVKRPASLAALSTIWN